jgi:hypothetical protein
MFGGIFVALHPGNPFLRARVLKENFGSHENTAVHFIADIPVRLFEEKKDGEPGV